jgi:hypothetical protein
MDSMALAARRPMAKAGNIPPMAMVAPAAIPFSTSGESAVLATSISAAILLTFLE